MFGPPFQHTHLDECMNYKLGICVNHVPSGTLVQVSLRAVFHAVSWESIYVPNFHRPVEWQRLCCPMTILVVQPPPKDRGSALLRKGTCRLLHSLSPFSAWAWWLWRLPRFLASYRCAGAFVRRPFLHFLEESMDYCSLIIPFCQCLSCPGGRWILLWVTWPNPSIATNGSLELTTATLKLASKATQTPFPKLCISPQVHPLWVLLSGPRNP